MLRRELRGLAEGQSVPSYASLYRRILDGDIPAEHDGRRWWIDRANLQDIARSLGVAA